MEFPLVVRRGQFAEKPPTESINLWSPLTNDQEPMSALTKNTFTADKSPNTATLSDRQQVNRPVVMELSAIAMRNKQSTIANPYLPRIVPRQLFQGLPTITAIPVPGFALNWCQPIPHVPTGACFPLSPHYCNKYFDYLQQRNYQKNTWQATTWEQCQEWSNRCMSQNPDSKGLKGLVSNVD